MPPAVVEDAVPVVGVAHHAVAQAVGGHRELDRHGGRLARHRVHLDHLAPRGEHGVDDGRVHDARQEVVPDHPLVVAHHLLARGREQVGRRHPLRRERVDHPVVEADERGMGLGDDQVLVVARVRDQRLPVRLAREVEAGMGLVRDRQVRHRGRGAGLQAHLVRLVELGAEVGSQAVERVEVEAGRARLLERGGGEGDAAGELALVEGQVVVDELAEVGVAGRDGAVHLAVAQPRHADGDLQPVGLSELGPLGPDPREPEGPLVAVVEGEDDGAGGLRRR